MIRYRKMHLVGALVLALALFGFAGDPALLGPGNGSGLALAFQCDPNTDPECNLPPPSNNPGGQPPGGPSEPEPQPPTQTEVSDRDGDGIVDAADSCPDTFGRKPDGCPIGRDNPTDPASDSATNGIGTGRGPQQEPSAAELAEQRRRCLSINEVLWAGTNFSRTHQYVELRNRCDEPMTLDGMRLRLITQDTPARLLDTLALSGTVSPQSYYLIVNNSLALKGVTANLVARFTLPEDDVALVLGDAFDEALNTANLGATGWYAGGRDRNGISTSMERNERALASQDDPDAWHANDGRTRVGTDAVGDPINGTPGRANSPAQN